MEEEKEDEDESVGPVLHYSGPPVVTPLMSQEDEIQVDFLFLSLQYLNQGHCHPNHNHEDNFAI